MEVPNPTDIKFVTTEDLLEEISSRFDGAIFVGCVRKSKSQAHVGWKCTGDYFSLVGLLEWAASRVDELEPSADDENELSG